MTTGTTTRRNRRAAAGAKRGGRVGADAGSAGVAGARSGPARRDGFLQRAYSSAESASMRSRTAVSSFSSSEA